MLPPMILECPACHARFKVPDSMIPPAGRNVRCSKCTHAWFMPGTIVAPPVKEVAPTEVPMDVAFSAEETFSEAAFIRPLIAPKKPSPFAALLANPTPFNIAAGLLAALWLGLAVVAYFPAGASSPLFTGLYRALGAAPVDGLLFADIKMERALEGAQAKFILSGSIRNHASAEQQVPTVRVTLKNRENKTIWGREYPVNTELKAGEIYPFRIANIETSFAKNVSAITLDMGNDFQLMVR